MELTKELADNFKAIGLDFIRLHDENNLSNEHLNFSVGEPPLDEDNNPLQPGDNLCDSVACHGGWGAFLYGERLNYDLYVFQYGAYEIAKKLGFDSVAHYERWADENADIWGNYYGIYMFSSIGHLAFGKTQYACTLRDIGMHYLGVGERIYEAIKMTKGWV